MVKHVKMKIYILHNIIMDQLNNLSLNELEKIFELENEKI